MEIIKVTDLGIKFKMLKRKRARTHDFLMDRLSSLRNPSIDFWALKHVAFTVNRGDTVGVIGRNGSGKSTLLRVIAGVYPPDEGKVSVQGEVSTLFGLGAGFQPELSGLDNIYLNGVLMGLPKKEIDGMLDRIIEFAELGEFIDMPVRTYSSGMHSRLGFAIAMNVTKDIVLIDEIMGAGDASFKEKCDREMSRIIGERTIVMVSHAMPTIQRFANKVIWLEKGQLVAQGEPKEVIQRYLAALRVNPSVQKALNDAH
jgi:ABC-type polysaccharide/polyol phosphate transport system ATPase subunit